MYLKESRVFLFVCELPAGKVRFLQTYLLFEINLGMFYADMIEQRHIRQRVSLLCGLDRGTYTG